MSASRRLPLISSDAVSQELSLRHHKMTVNTVAPGLTVSETVMAQQPEFMEMVRVPTNKSRSIQRDQRPEDLVGTVIYLASPASDFVTGQTILVDGGSLNN
jgi:NAD(P)-dependent dehydrogenase (short-subunit alcohol dehydrogenase family)